MKTNMKINQVLMLCLLLLTTALIAPILTAQEIPLSEGTQERKLSIVIKNDGTEFIGYIISQDERELLIETENIGRVVIPKHEIREIREVTQRDMRDGVYVGNNIFSSRYFLTTNGLSMNKGDHYALINWYGPEAHFCLADNFTLGGMTTWLGVPVILSMKYAIPVTKNFHIGLGVLGGTLSWYDFGTLGGLAYLSLTIGDHNNNLTVSGGYAGITGGEDFSGGSDPLFSVAGMVRLGKNISLVGDSFIYAGSDFAALFIPGLRFSRNESRAFQFGFAGAYGDGQFVPFPIPMLGWFLKI